MNFLNELILPLLAEPAKVKILFSSLRNGHQGKSELNTHSVVCAPHFTVMPTPVYRHTHTRTHAQACVRTEILCLGRELGTRLHCRAGAQSLRGMDSF